ncbi:ABC transporter substrate-binding protein [Microbacterium sp. Au-Mic1]|uniref:ABC transporter substrate-binding protein n=1 Tax=Microbacterium sp. Au-Mic1 TaxID=2906457 RepID=UPI001E44F9EA|nr:ABC transporter substrate-binding protein [Microbacterium sp. Au-Mic1]MCE4025503.1 ABC transporter substrate-binding protein [Microbacterium sp. Au-Mic1]
MPDHSRISKRLAAAMLTAAATAALLSGCSGGTTPKNTAPATPINVAFAFTESVQDSGYFVADDAGYYAKLGVKVTFTPGGGSSPAPEVAIASGQAQIGIESNTSRLFSYLSKADDIVIIGQVFQEAPNGLVSLKARPVRNPQDLDGARIMGPSTNQAFVAGLMKINDVTNYSFVPGGADIGALQSGQADAMLAFATNQPVALEKQGLTPDKDFFFTPFDKLNYHVMADVIVVSKSFLKEHRDAVVAFLKASTQGWKAAMKDPHSAAQLTVSKYATNQGLDAATQEISLQKQIPLMTSPLTEAKGLLAVDPSVITSKVYPGLEAAGLTGLPDASKVVDMSLLEDAQR